MSAVSDATGSVTVTYSRQVTLRRRNYYCQNATPRGGYCRIHHNQRAFDAGAVDTAVVGAVVLVVLAVVVQVYTVEGLMMMLYDLTTRVMTALT